MSYDQAVGEPADRCVRSDAPRGGKGVLRSRNGFIPEARCAIRHCSPSVLDSLRRAQPSPRPTPSRRKTASLDGHERIQAHPDRSGAGTDPLRERERGREGGRERGRERGREGGREGEREGGTPREPAQSTVILLIIGTWVRSKSNGYQPHNAPVPAADCV